jgi:hypothetical protein
MKWPRQILGFGAAALGLVVAVIPSDGQGQEMPCTGEIRTYCPDVQPGGGRIMKCLKEHESKLSPTCMQRMHDLEDYVRGPMGACRDDWAKFCYHPRASTERQGIMECLQANRMQLSSDCKKAMQGAEDPQRRRTRGMMP